jgi:hypothetical protein
VLRNAPALSDAGQRWKRGRQAFGSLESTLTLLYQCPATDFGPSSFCPRDKGNEWVALNPRGSYVEALTRKLLCRDKRRTCSTEGIKQPQIAPQISFKSMHHVREQIGRKTLFKPKPSVNGRFVIRPRNHQRAQTRLLDQRQPLFRIMKKGEFYKFSI